MRSITFSECSNTLRLSENELQLLAGALDSHLQRRDARPRQPRHFVVLEVLDVLEEERLAVFRRESGERPADGVACGERSVRTGVAGADPAPQLSVARPHVVYTQRLSHDVTVPRSCDAGQRSRGIWGRAAHDRPRSQMSKRLIPPALAAALLAGGACYQDDTVPSAPQSVKSLTRVLLTDAPFPYDSRSEEHTSE